MWFFVCEKSGFFDNLVYGKVNLKTNGKQKRRREIIWFKPTDSPNIKTNVNKFFLKTHKHLTKIQLNLAPG